MWGTGPARLWMAAGQPSVRACDSIHKGEDEWLGIDAEIDVTIFRVLCNINHKILARTVSDNIEKFFRSKPSQIRLVRRFDLWRTSG